MATYTGEQQSIYLYLLVHLTRYIIHQNVLVELNQPSLPLLYDLNSQAFVNLALCNPPLQTKLYPFPFA